MRLSTVCSVLVAVSCFAEAMRNGAALRGASTTTGPGKRGLSAGALRAMASPVGPFVTITAATAPVPKAPFTVSRIGLARADDQRETGRSTSAIAPVIGAADPEI